MVRYGCECRVRGQHASSRHHRCLPRHTSVPSRVVPTLMAVCPPWGCGRIAGPGRRRECRRDAGDPTCRLGDASYEGPATPAIRPSAQATPPTARGEARPLEPGTSGGWSLPKRGRGEGGFLPGPRWPARRAPGSTAHLRTTESRGVVNGTTYRVRSGDTGERHRYLPVLHSDLGLSAGRAAGLPVGGGDRGVRAGGQGAGYLGYQAKRWVAYGWRRSRASSSRCALQHRAVNPQHLQERRRSAGVCCTPGRRSIW